MREFPQVAIKGKISHNSSYICSECPQYTLTASRAVEAGARTHSEESRNPSFSGFSYLKNSLVPSSLPQYGQTGCLPP